MKPKKPTDKILSPQIELAGRQFTLVYDMEAHYRMGTLDHPFALEDISDPKRAYAALLAWVWACLPEEAAPPTPKALAKHVPMPRVPAFMEALAAAVKVANDAAKNVDGSTSKPSSTLSSPSHQAASAA